MLRVTSRDVIRAALLILACGATAPVRAAEPLPPPLSRPIDFVADVRPLLARHCWSCHGSSKQEAGLRLDRRTDLLAGGDQGPVVVLGKSAESRLIHLVSGSDPDQRMPPEGELLSQEAVSVLRAWIDQQCVWPATAEAQEAAPGAQHWAFQPLRVVAPPAVRRTDWPVNAVDHFILAELEKRGLTPSPEADRYTLIRRLSLDIIGLLPSVAEVDAFVHDTRPQAYELLVDRLLASPHFGERWGRHWLDMARYADSDGYEKDNPRPDAYRWRDWVIDAVHTDMPFDQFTIEQLAGDLLPQASPMQRLATAFHRQTLTNTEGGTDQEQFRVEACFDRTETTAAVWLGLTLGCARCHSHKYDPISQREYYRMFAVFNNGDEQTTVVPKSPAEVAAYEQAQQQHSAQIEALQERIRAAQVGQTAALAVWETRTQELLAPWRADPWRQHTLSELQYESDAGVTFQPQADGSVLVSGANPERAIYTVTGQASVPRITGVRLDVLPDKSLPASGPGRVAHGNFVLNEVTLEWSATADFQNPQRIECTGAKADFEQVDRPWRAQDVIDGRDESGWAIAPQFGKPHWLVVSFRQPLTLSQPAWFRVRLSQQYGREHTIGRFKVTLQSGVEPAVALPDDVVKILNLPVAQRSAVQQQALRDHFSRQESPTKELFAQLDELRKQAPAKPELTVRVLAQRTQSPRKTFVFKRGEFLSPRLDLEALPGGLEVLPPLQPRGGQAVADRLDLARWLVSGDQPLTPRVIVNQFWRQLFGAGLVRTPTDFGTRGERPSHPELLDWLAADFLGRTAGGSPSATVPNEGPRPWSRKALLKRLVMSATYRQSSRHRRELQEVDPQNVLLGRQNRLRVEAEIVRDVSLDASGLLSRKIGGPSVFPPLPAGIAELSYAGNFKWTVSTGEDRHRRGMYTFFKRTAPHPNLTTFDCPDANLFCVERRTSNTPLQALTTLNNETFAEAARALAKRTLAVTGGDDTTRLIELFRICVARPPSDAERAQLAQLLAETRAWYAGHPAEARQLIGSDAVTDCPPEVNAAWIATSRIVLNLDEFITRE